MEEVEKLKQAIANTKFDWRHMAGFRSNPHNALLAGAAIGYGLGLDEGQAAIKKLMGLLPDQSNVPAHREWSDTVGPEVGKGET